MPELPPPLISGLAPWFVGRHVVYAGAAIALIIYIPASIIAIGSFIVFIHIYKVARFMGDEKHRNVSPAAPMSPADALSTDAKGEP